MSPLIWCRDDEYPQIRDQGEGEVKDSLQIFIDGTGDVHVQDGILRVDLFALSAEHKDENGKPVPEIVNQLVMSATAFARLTETCVKTMKNIQDSNRSDTTSQSLSAPEPASATEPDLPSPEEGGPERGKAKRKRNSPRI